MHTTGKGAMLISAKLALAVAVAVSVVTLQATAQTTTEKGNFGAPQSAENQEPWLIDCGEAGGFSQAKCRLLQTVIIRETKQPLLTAAIERRPDGEGMSMVLKVPHGVFIPPGMALELEGQKPQVLRYRLSDATGLFAAMILSPEYLEALKTAGALKVSIVTANGEKVGVPVSLQGFTEAFDKFKTGP